MATTADNRLSFYESKFDALQQQLVRALGVDTVNLIIERAAVEISHLHPALRLIRLEGDTIIMDAFQEALADEPQEQVRSVFSALYAAMLVILARMLGKEIAGRLANSLDTERVLEGQQLGT